MEWDHENGVWLNDKAVSMSELPSPLYIFGYGSLMWKPSDVLENFQVFKCSCQGWRRMFSQRSMDHRGTIHFPGLVATLIDDDTLVQAGWKSDIEEESICIGVVYLIPPDKVEWVIAELDYRERGGYTRHLLPVTLLENTPSHPAHSITEVVAYTGLSNNPNYYLPIINYNLEYEVYLRRFANIIAYARGPSGSNADYLISLTNFMQNNHIQDTHLLELANLVKKRLNLNDIQAYEREQQQTSSVLLGWGANDAGQVSCTLERSEASEIIPQPVDMRLSSFLHSHSPPYSTKVYAGGKLSAVLVRDSEGSSTMHVWGELTGTASAHSVSDTVGVLTIPGVEDLSMGNTHSLLLMQSGEVIAVGEDYHQCSGGGPVIQAHFTSFVDMKKQMSPSSDKQGASNGTHANVVKVVAGVRHSAVISSTGELTVWGDIRCPVFLHSWRPENGTVVDIALGLHHVVAVDSLGCVWSWGRNKHQALGRDGNSCGTEGVPGLVSGLEPGVKWVSVTCGWSHSVLTGVRPDGRLTFAAWGRADLGQLPSVEAVSPFRSVFSLDELPSKMRIEQMWAAPESTFAADEDGLLWATGWNEHGNMGVGDCENRYSWTPVMVVDSARQQLQLNTACRAFACAGGHSIALAVKQ